MNARFTPYLAAVGAVPSPFDCYLVNRGIKTLHRLNLAVALSFEFSNILSLVRMERHQTNALAVALYLRNSKRVVSVAYPGQHLITSCKWM
jgi:cystathionine gamma-lyase